MSNNSYINPLKNPATPTDMSMIGGLPIVMGLLGPLVLIKLADKLGRKLFLQIMALGMSICTIALSFATLAIQIIIARCVLMVFFNAYSVIIQAYISEICEEDKKSKYLCIMGVCLPLGFIYGFFFGPIFSYRAFTNILGIPIWPFLICFCFAPDSPVYLLSRGKHQECLISLTKLRSNKSDKELQIDLIQINKILIATNSTNKDKTIFELFQKKEIRLASALTFLLGFGSHVCGMSAILTFLGPLLVNEDAQAPLSENTMTVTVAFVQMITIVCTSFIIQNVSRRMLLLASSLGCGITVLMLGFFYYFRNDHLSLVISLTWLPFVLIIIFNVIFSLGLGCVPMALISEFFPTDFIPAAVSFFVCVNALIASVIIFLYPLVSNTFGEYWCMWIFSSLSFLTGTLIYFFLPETKGKSIVEIQKLLR